MNKFHDDFHIPEEYARRIDALRLMDDDFMTIALDGANEAVELILRIIMERQDIHVIKVETQRGLNNLVGHSVRLDVLVRTTEGELYNVEIQRADHGAGSRRARYNLGLMDMHELAKGADYSKLPEAYVVFITENDVLGAGRAVYHIERTILETGNQFNDGGHIIYVNGAHTGTDAIAKLMSDFKATDAAAMHYPALAERVSKYKDEQEGRFTMCKIMEELASEKWEKGHAEGRTEGKAEMLLELLKDGVCDIQKLAKFSKWEPDAIRAFAKDHGFNI